LNIFQLSSDIASTILFSRFLSFFSINYCNIYTTIAQDINYINILLTSLPHPEDPNIKYNIKEKITCAVAQINAIFRGFILLKYLIRILNGKIIILF
jgi:hypothetical protein